MALSLKVDTEEIPSILKMLGLGGMPAAADDTGGTPPVDSSLAGEAQPEAQPNAQPAPDAPAASSIASTHDTAQPPTKLLRLQQALGADQPAPVPPPLSPDPDVAKLVAQSQGQNPDAVPDAGPIAQRSLMSVLSGVPAPTVAPPKPTFQEKHPTLSKILGAGLEFAQDAGPGIGAKTFGEGFSTAAAQPTLRKERQLGLQEKEAQIASIPIQRAGQIAGIFKTKAEADKATADADKSRAELKGMPIKQALEQAQAEAANYKEDPNLGLIDLRTKQPVASNAGMAPLSEEEAAVLGKNTGDKVPLKLKNTANEIVNRGVRSVSANGRQLLVDAKGKTIKDLGVATPIASINLQNGPYLNPIDAAGNINPQLKAAIDNVGQYKVPIDQALSRVPAAGKAGFQTALKQLYPDYDANQYAVKQAVLKDFASTKGGTAGGSALAFNTALSHLGLLNDAVDALGNGNIRLLNAIGQSYKKATGSPVGTNFDTIKQAVSGEVGKAFSGGNLTQGEQEAVKGPLDKANSPDQLRGAIKGAIKLMGGKLDALEFTRTNQLGPLSERTIISPEAAATRNRLLGNEANTTPGATANNPTPNLPAHVQARDKKLGIVY